MLHLKMITMANFKLYMLYHHFKEMGKKKTPKNICSCNMGNRLERGGK